jgi:hypothetical protein
METPNLLSTTEVMILMIKSSLSVTTNSETTCSTEKLHHSLLTHQRPPPLLNPTNLDQAQPTSERMILLEPVPSQSLLHSLMETPVEAECLEKPKITNYYLSFS